MQPARAVASVRGGGHCPLYLPSPATALVQRGCDLLLAELASWVWQWNDHCFTRCSINERHADHAAAAAAASGDWLASSSDDLSVAGLFINQPRSATETLPSVQPDNLALLSLGSEY